MHPNKTQIHKERSESLRSKGKQREDEHEGEKCSKMIWLRFDRQGEPARTTVHFVIALKHKRSKNKKSRKKADTHRNLFCFPKVVSHLNALEDSNDNKQPFRSGPHPGGGKEPAARGLLVNLHSKVPSVRLHQHRVTFETLQHK